MGISMITAVSEDGAIGRGNALPWRLPADLKHFRQLTTGHPIVMGRRTWESIGRRPLPGRLNIVLTRSAGQGEQTAGEAEADAVFVPTLDAALAAASEAEGSDEIFVIGGEQVYRAAWERADRIYLTLVQTRVPDADAFFPEIDPEVWREVDRVEHAADERNPFEYAFVTFERG